MKRKTSKARVELRPSGIHGIGCYADLDIREGEIVRVWDTEDSRWVPESKAHGSPHAHLYKRFGIRSTGGYWAPVDFIRISTGWYMNHSAEPNLQSDDGEVTYHAIRDIPMGEELTIDYRRMDEKFDNLDRDVVVPAVAAPKARLRKTPKARRSSGGVSKRKETGRGHRPRKPSKSQ